MDKKTIGSVSASDSFFFQLFPHYFKVEHGFAKTMKPNTTYRLSIFKGIQKADEMTQPIKGKLVGGKILFDQSTLTFYLPIYTATRNIEFIIKVLQTRPNEQEMEIASHKIKSGDFVKKFKNENISYSREEAVLLDHFSLVFDLFVHNSKSELDKVVKDYQSKMKTENRNNIVHNREKTPKKNQISSQIHSQSDNRSETGSANREGFVSKNKLSRKGGHAGQLKSSHGGSDRGSQRSRSPQSKSFVAPLPPNESKNLVAPLASNDKTHKFLHSSQKITPLKILEDDQQEKQENLVTVGKKENQVAETRSRGVSTVLPVNSLKSNIQLPKSTKHGDSYGNLQPNSDPFYWSGNIQKFSKATQQVHDLEFKAKQPMFEIEKKYTDSSLKTPQVKKIQYPPFQPSKYKSENLAPFVHSQYLHSSEQEPISKPSHMKSKASQQSIKKQEQYSENTLFDSKHADYKEMDNEKNNQGERLVELDMKSLQPKGKGNQMSPYDHSRVRQRRGSFMRLSTWHKIDEETQQLASTEYKGMRDTLFYIVFSIVSILLFWNAVTPSRRV